MKDIDQLCKMTNVYVVTYRTPRNSNCKHDHLIVIVSVTVVVPA